MCDAISHRRLRGVEGLARVRKTVQPRDVIAVLRIEEIAGLARLRPAKGPRAHARNQFAVRLRWLVFVGFDNEGLEPERLRGIVELVWLLRTRHELRQPVRLAIHLGDRRVAGLNANQNVSQCERISRARIQFDQMVAELRLDGLRQLAGLQVVNGLFELRNEAATHALAKIAALGARHTVVRFAPCHIIELRATGNLGAKLRNFRTGGRAVSGGHHARNRHHAQHGAAGTLELFLVCLVKGLQLTVIDRLVRFGWGRTECHEADRCAVVGVAPGLPQLVVGDVESTGDLLEELLFWNLGPKILLQRDQQA